MAQNIDILITAKDNASKQIDSAKKSIIDLKWSVAQMWSVTSTVFAWLKTWAIALWWAIAGLWAFGVKAGADMEQVNIAFKTLYWSSEQAKKTLESLADFAAKTPFEFPELADSALKLQNIAGISKDQLIPTLTSLGDIAASQGKWIDQITEAFNDAIVWEFERLKEFGIRATQEGDKVTFSYKWQTTVVQKNNEAIADYISKLWQAQGVAWAMDAQSNTLNWRISTMKDNFSFLVMEIVWVTKSWEIVKDGFFDKISKAINYLASFMETYKPQIIWFFQSIWDTAAYIAQIGIEWWNEYGTEIKELGKTIQQIFEKDWPIAMGVLLESFKAWLELLWVLIKWINIIFRGEFLETMYAGFEEFSLWFSQMWEDIKLSVTGIVDTIVSYIMWKFDSLISFVTEKIDWLKQKAQEAKNLIDSIASLTTQAGKSFVQNFSIQWVAWAIAGAKADGGPVSSGKTYMVWERWPELFVPKTNGTIIPNGATSPSISINMGGITVNNKNDADYLVDKLKTTLIRELQLSKLWIS